MNPNINPAAISISGIGRGSGGIRVLRTIRVNKISGENAP
jgi:hypothetical protein